jgi:glycosyltransferase involved in cell wall biosynthesis
MLRSEKRPLVSVVVTTKNEEKNIRRCLESITQSSYKPVEIIVVDNGSSDRTVKIANEYTTQVFQHGPERSAQRNYGMSQKATGDFVMYVDADMILSRMVLENCVESMINDSKLVALHVPEVVLGRSYFCRVRNFERSFYDGTVIDGARFFRRLTFVASGGFDEVLFQLGSGEDWDIDLAIGKFGQIGLLPKFAELPQKDVTWEMEAEIRELTDDYVSNHVCIYHNESSLKFWTYLTKKSYYSLGFAGYVNKWGRDNPNIRKQFSITYRYCWVFLEKQKWRRFFRRPDLIFGLYFLRFCVGVAFLAAKAGVVKKKVPKR